MARVATIKKVLPTISNFLNGQVEKSYSQKSLEVILNKYGKGWGLPASMNTDRFIEGLLDSNILSAEEINSLEGESKIIYRLPIASNFDIINTVNRKGFFSHYTALSFHNLTLQIPKIFYLNIEHESSNARKNVSMKQSDIDYAFSNEQRKSTNEYRWGVYRIVVLRGKHTNQLGVNAINTNKGTFKITDLERTLIDAVIRPAYCGGVVEVLNAFETAKDKVDIKRLADYLKKLDYSYPYSQCVGFYLEKAKYSSSDINHFNKAEKKFDFYLTYNIRQKEYDSNWRLYYPKGL